MRQEKRDIAGKGARMVKKQWWLLFLAGILLGGFFYGAEFFLSKAQADLARVPAGDFIALNNSDSPANQSNRNRANPGTGFVGKAEKDAGSEEEADKKPVSSERTQVSVSSGSSPLDKVKVKIYLTNDRKVEKVSLETYVLGVLAGEMPPDFELEALKAQAIAARTYIVKRLSSGTVDEISKKGADVSDTIAHQAYISKDELRARWKSEEQKAKLEKLEQAVNETKGLIVTYNGGPIEAAFFSTSNGYTENSEDYWEMSLPYLRSVESPWDKELSPRFRQQTEIGVKELYRKLGISGKAAASKLKMKLGATTEGKRVKEIRINGVSFTGREVREKLGLASTQFTWKIDKEKIVFTTYGMGHGVGMSQWGANGMAKEGKDAIEILEHYYTGATVEQASKLAMSLPS